MSEFTLSQIVEALSEPFPAAYVEWKPQQVSKDGGKALAAAYVDARRYQERLDLVCPDWSSRIELMADGHVAKVSLTIAGVIREDVGEADGNDPNTVTTAVAQAFKRACAAFGLGRYLYFLPMTWVDYDPQKRKLLNTPTLPDWALPAGERLEKRTQAAVQRVAAEKFEAAPGPEVIFPSGKYAGKSIQEVAAIDPSYLMWLVKDYQPKNEAQSFLKQAAANFLSAAK